MPSSPTEITQITQQLPDYLEPHMLDLLARAGYESSQQYTPYPNQRLAYFAPMEQEALARYGEMGVSGTSPELIAAGQSAASLMQGWDPGIYTGEVSSGYRAGAPGGVNYQASSYSNT